MKKRFAFIAPLLLVPFLSGCEQKVYTVTFDAGSGNQITSSEVKKGDLVTKPDDPTRLGYDFINWTYEGEEWDFDLNTIEKDIVLQANYLLHDYTVTFKNSDGTVLETQENLHYGDTVTYKGSEPVAPNQEIKYTYTFTGWDKELKVTDDMVFTATYTYRDKKYHYLYKDTYANKVLYEYYTDEENDTKAYYTDVPKDEVRNGVHYHFLEWELNDNGKGEKIYTAKYDRYSVDLTYNRNVVTGYTGTGNEVVIPLEHDGYKVEIIGNNCFKGLTFITSVELPTTIDDVYSGAFEGCTGIKKLNFEGSLHFLEVGAFKDCTSLEEITIPNSIINLTNKAFEGCSALKYNEYENGLYLGNKDNPYLVLSSVKNNQVTSFVVHEKCEIIAGNAFLNCSNLENVSIPSHIRAFGQDTLKGCTSLKPNEKDNGLYLGNEDNPYVVLYKAKDLNITEINIQDGCKSICDQALMGCVKLENVTMPDSLVEIGMLAFQNCKALKSVVVPKNVTNIYAFAFCQCSNLESITLSEGLLYLEPDVFSQCKKLDNVVIPDSLIYLGFEAFYLCENLKSISLPNNIKEIFSKAFYACKSLETITLPEGVELIERDAFQMCINLQSINLPNSLKEIGQKVFSGDKNLKYIYFDGTEEEWNAVKKDDAWNQGISDVTVLFKTVVE